MKRLRFPRRDGVPASQRRLGGCSECFAAFRPRRQLRSASSSCRQLLPRPLSSVGALTLRASRFFWGGGFFTFVFFFLAASLASGSPSASCLHTVSVSLGHLVPFHAHLTFNCYSEHVTVPKQQQLDFQNRTSVQIFQ